MLQSRATRPPGSRSNSSTQTTRLWGGIGTWDDGQPTSQGTWIWINAIAGRTTTANASGRGEVLSGGTMRGYFEIEGVTNACVATNHSFTLKAQ